MAWVLITNTDARALHPIAESKSQGEAASSEFLRNSPGDLNYNPRKSHSLGTQRPDERFVINSVGNGKPLEVFKARKWHDIIQGN